MRFVDIRKRVYTFPKMGEKAYFIAVPTSAGTGSEATPFAVITDERTGVKYPLADYELMPNMAIVDADFHMTAPKGLTAASGIDAVTHCLEAYASMMATDYTDGLAIRSLQMIFQYLPRAYDNALTIRWLVRRWPTQPPWPVWHLPTRSWVCATLWPISWARSTTCPTAWQTR